MKTVLNSIKSRILAQLVFLILAAMLLINIVMIKFSERDLLKTRIEAGRLLISSIEEIISIKSISAKTGPDSKAIVNLSPLLKTVGYKDLHIVNRRGNRILFSVSSSVNEALLKPAREAMDSETVSIDYHGKVWGVFWWSYEKLSISSPIYLNGRLYGGINLTTSLIPVYKSLRKSEKFILVYILMDTIILGLVGLYLLSRTVVKPVQKMLKITSDYKNGDMFPAFNHEAGNEIKQLSHSLNNLIKRLDKSRHDLKDNIESLKKTNLELKQAQNEIIRSEKLASIGRLAAGVAHEIGNPLGIVLGYLDIIHNSETDEKEKEDFLNRIDGEIRRINRIIRNLLDFSRSSSGSRDDVHIHDMLENTANIMKPQPVMENLKLKLELNAANDIVHADPDEIKQVFLNIIMNSADAICRDNRKNREGSITVNSFNREDNVIVILRDNGPGISEESLPHIFDPFYTTKEPGEGTGLGLSVCYRIIEAIGGTIEAESKPDDGTEIKISLPLKPASPLSCNGRID